MPLQLAANDPARADPRTGAAVTYLRIDALTLIDELRDPPRATITIGIYPDASTAGANKERVVRRDITLTPSQAQTLADLVTDRIYQALSAANGPFPNAVIVP